jgi:hypothetical protein
MRYLVVSVYDRVAQLYAVPNFVLSKGSTIRAFADQINKPDENNQLYQHPDDFDLYYLGEFDDEQAVFSITMQPEVLARGAHLKINKE